MHTFEKAREFIYRNARPLDLAKFQYHFEDGGQNAVLTALATYQNADGGFAHALEPDCWNPNSSPIQTWAATEELFDIGFSDASHPIVRGILNFLSSGAHFDGKRWSNCIPSNNDHPHAPWWNYANQSARSDSYNPTAALAGFIVRFADKGSELFDMGCHIVHEAVDDLADDETCEFLLPCYARLWEYCAEANLHDIIDLDALQQKLHKLMSPLEFVKNCDSVGYHENKQLIEEKCHDLVKTQLSDGSWNIPFNWGEDTAYPSELAITTRWWKGYGAVGDLCYLRDMGFIQPKNSVKRT